MAFPFAGKRYKLQSSDKMEEFLSALGVSDDLRKLILSAIPTLELVQNGDSYTLKTYTSIKNSEMSFKSGVEFEHISTLGMKVKKVVTVSGNTMMEEVKVEKPTTITYVFSPNELQVTYTGGGVVATRIFKPE